MEEFLKWFCEVREELGDYYIVENIIAWFNNHDDKDITCMTDVIDTLKEDIIDDLQDGI